MKDPALSKWVGVFWHLGLTQKIPPGQILILSHIMYVLIQIIYCFIEFGSPSGAASNLGLTIVTLADFSDYDYYYDGDFLYNYNGQDFFIIIIVVFL